MFSQGYRPGTLGDRGLSPEELAALRPGLVYVSLCAFAHKGPWASRRGFDTVVQTVSGITHRQGGGGARPDAQGRSSIRSRRSTIARLSDGLRCHGRSPIDRLRPGVERPRPAGGYAADRAAPPCPSGAPQALLTGRANRGGARADAGTRFYPVSAIDYCTGYLMAFGAMVALNRRAREGGSWLVRISLAQVGKWIVDLGEIGAGRPEGCGPRIYAGGTRALVHGQRNPIGSAEASGSRGATVRNEAILGSAVRAAGLP